MTAAPAEPWKVPIPGHGEISALLERTVAPRRLGVYVCAHGAGGHMLDRGMSAVSRVMIQRGLDVVRFNFLYREARSGRPDPMPLLQQCIAAVVERTASEGLTGPVVIGGRSMGGRAASMMAADGFGADGLLLLAYPLHPAGKPEQLRDAHLPAIHMPVLCINGTRDALCRRDLMERVLTSVRGSWTMHWLEGADHSFRVLKSSGRSEADILDEVGMSVAMWMPRLTI